MKLQINKERVKNQRQGNGKHTNKIVSRTLSPEQTTQINNPCHPVVQTPTTDIKCRCYIRKF